MINYNPYNIPYPGQGYTSIPNNAILNNTPVYPGQQYNTNYQQPITNMPMNNQPSYGLNGRCVQSADNITFQDIPNNGSYALFPREDMTEIYARALNGDGSVDKRVYRLVNDNTAEQSQDTSIQAISADDLVPIMQCLGDISTRMEKLEKSLTKQLNINAPKAKKEVEANG